jgi:hypothetical protein
MVDNLPNCITCKEYYITYDASMPYGCRAMKFKSAKNPAQVVFTSSGIHCQLFMLKKGVENNEKKK